MSDLSLYYSTDALKLYLISSVVIIMVVSWLVSNDKKLKEQKVIWRMFIAICCIYIITIAVTKYDESRVSFEAKTNHDISLEVSRSLTLRCIKELAINEEEMNSENALDTKLNKLAKCQLEGLNEINQRLMLQKINIEKQGIKK
ncbi:hypothetical protein A6J66_001150 [Yersinia enterocolitica]|nr:hypothetical protein A6J66_001150 [Yersinia enterocolitica]